MPRYDELCQLAGRYNGGEIAPGWIAERKHDGWRCLWFRGRNGQPGLWTRNGMDYGGLDHIARRLADLEDVAGEPLFIDGEFVLHDGPDSLAATKTYCERGWKTEPGRGYFRIFDGFPGRLWQRGGTDEPLGQRKASLCMMVDALEYGPEPWEWRAGSRGKSDRGAISVIHHEPATDAAQVMSMARAAWDRGEEGLMLKDSAAPYWRKRSSAWLKVKRGN